MAEQFASIVDDYAVDPHAAAAALARLAQRTRDALLGAGLTAFHHDLQPRLAGRGQRHFGHGEEAVEKDQENEQRNVHARAAAKGDDRP